MLWFSKPRGRTGSNCSLWPKWWYRHVIQNFPATFQVMWWHFSSVSIVMHVLCTLPVCAMISCSLGIMSVNTSFLAVSSSESTPGQQNFKLVWPSWESCYGEWDPSPQPRPFRQNLLQLQCIVSTGMSRAESQRRTRFSSTSFPVAQSPSKQTGRAVPASEAFWVGMVSFEKSCGWQSETVDKKRVGDLRERCFFWKNARQLNWQVCWIILLAVDVILAALHECSCHPMSDVLWRPMAIPIVTFDILYDFFGDVMPNNRWFQGIDTAQNKTAVQSDVSHCFNTFLGSVASRWVVLDMLGGTTACGSLAHPSPNGIGRCPGSSRWLWFEFLLLVVIVQCIYKARVYVFAL